MKNIYLFLIALFVSNIIIAQCNPATVAHYNIGDFPFTSSSGVTVTLTGTNSGTLGPYPSYPCAPVDANTIRMDPTDTAIFTFSQPITDISFVAGVMNTTENGEVTSNNGIPTLTTNCSVDLTINGSLFVETGSLNSPVINVSIPGGATQISIICYAASTNGVFTIDILDCITPAIPTGIKENETETISLYPNPNTGVFNLSGLETGSFYSVYNVLGEKILDGIISDDETLIKMSTVSPGLYFLRTANTTKRFVVSK